MLKTLLISAVTLAAVSGSAHAAGMPTSLTFDGYCDGVTLVKDYKKAGLITANHAEANCGVSDTPMIGPLAMKLNGNKDGLALTDSSYPTDGLSLVYIIKSDGTWNLLSPEIGVVNSGTWTAGYADNGVQGGVPSYTH
jgi:hypothetical protein